MGTVNSQLPKVSNIKALDVYFGMCFIYVFAALIEFSVVCYLHKGSKRRAAERAKANEKSTAVVKKEKVIKIFVLAPSNYFAKHNV